LRGAGKGPQRRYVGVSAEQLLQHISCPAEVLLHVGQLRLDVKHLRVLRLRLLERLPLLPGRLGLTASEFDADDRNMGVGEQGGRQRRLLVGLQRAVDLAACTHQDLATKEMSLAQRRWPGRGDHFVHQPQCDIHLPCAGEQPGLRKHDDRQFRRQGKGL